jgi:hypothetical protein
MLNWFTADEMTKSERFQYSPLLRERDEIRLVRILCSKDLKSPISAELVHRSFNEDLVYEALSYAWGDNAKTHSISLGGHEFGVTANLYTALCSLRQPDKDR